MGFQTSDSGWNRVAGVGAEGAAPGRRDLGASLHSTPATRRILLLLQAAIVIAAICAGKVLTAAEKRPNILFCISDDQSWIHTSFAGDPVVKTPTFDRIARQGVYFRHAYCSVPSCTASRGSILTGQDFWRLGPGANLFGTLPSKFAVYPDLLEATGYRVGYMAKGWAPGDFSAGGWKRNPAGPKFKSFPEFFKTVSQDEPFCFWFGSTDPHRPYVKDSGVQSGKKLADVPLPAFLPDSAEVRGDILDYYVEIERFDRQVGEMLALLKKHGQLDNTIVIVTSDNGMPFPRAKTNLYDYGSRMPLAIQWPTRLVGGRQVDDFVNLIDIAPTLLQATGVPIPKEMTGRSLMPILTSEKSGQIDPQRNFVVVGRERHGWNRDPNIGYPCRAIRTDDYLYIRNYQPQRRPGFDTDGGPSKDYFWQHRNDETVHPLYLRWFEQRPAEELYVLRDDPDQMQNVAERADLAKVKQRLRGQLEAYQKQAADPRVTGQGEQFDRYRYFARPTRNQKWFKQFYQTRPQGNK